ncbi:hypothetical protein [Candidatus Parabeggiatoa sp. HSG14]|uniref:hypothetical protein n=1 Tax=Candidatus Parabeggiatoa sp. HSG14 TaxID=3055593 RepID=UPI0025A8681B|nr:hypothetical protein [Thiotrichales bacterium HSG14]
MFSTSFNRTFSILMEDKYMFCNQLVTNHANYQRANPIYQAGTAQFVMLASDHPKYNLPTSIFNMQVDWADWVESVMVIGNANLQLLGDPLTISNKAKEIYGKLNDVSLQVFIELNIYNTKVVAKRVFIPYEKEKLDVLITINDLYKNDVMDFDELFNPKKSGFETDSRWQARRISLLNWYNKAVIQQDSRYKSTIASIEKDYYQHQSEILPISLTWPDWAISHFSLSSQDLNISIPLNDAVKMAKDSRDKPIFINISIEDQKLTAAPILIWNNKQYSVNYNTVSNLRSDCNERCISLASEYNIRREVQRAIDIASSRCVTYSSKPTEECHECALYCAGVRIGLGSGCRPCVKKYLEKKIITCFDSCDDQSYQ